ncbi:MAG: hypothetical protein WBA41_17270 [Rivularia sp. (in: cyanobacteria)]
MSLTLVVSAFKSRATRKAITGKGVRKFLPKAGSIAKKQPKSGIAKLWDGFAKFGVSLLKKVWEGLSSFVSWSASAIWGGIVAAKEFLFNFNWNPSDAQLDNDMKQAFSSLPGLAGGFLGKASGYLLCGALPGAVIFSFNEALGTQLFIELGEEALDELAGALANIIRASFAAIGQAAFAFSHKQIRTLWRESDDKFKKRLQKTGLKEQFVNEALAERNKPFIIREKLDSAVESIKQKPLREFVENFLEEFDESCVEAGYVIAGGIDNYIAQQAVTKDIMNGKPQNIEVEVMDDGKVKLKEYKEKFKK